TTGYRARGSVAVAPQVIPDSHSLNESLQSSTWRSTSYKARRKSNNETQLSENVWPDGHAGAGRSSRRDRPDVGWSADGCGDRRKGSPRDPDVLPILDLGQRIAARPRWRPGTHRTGQPAVQEAGPAADHAARSRCCFGDEQ